MGQVTGEALQADHVSDPQACGDRLNSPLVEVVQDPACLA